MLAPEQQAETVLVVDDDPLERRLFQDLLASAGYRVETVDRGQDAIDFVRKNAVNLVLLDVHLTDDLDGIETYRRILQLRPGQKAAVLTGGADNDQITTLLLLGIRSWARKPVTPRRLVEMVRTELDRQPDSGASRGPSPSPAFGW